MPAEIFLDLLAERIAIKADKTVNLSLEIIGEKLVITPDREVAGVVVRGNEILAGRVRTKGGRWTDGNLTPQAIYNIVKEHVLAVGYYKWEGRTGHSRTRPATDGGRAGAQGRRRPAADSADARLRQHHHHGTLPRTAAQLADHGRGLHPD